MFFDRDGARLPAAGFDAVIGNPPWDMIRADAGTADARANAARDVASVLRFTRDAGVYTAQSDGHANRYQLFVERAMALTRHGGRIGLVLPSGLATDHGSAPLRQLLLSRCDVDAHRRHRQPPRRLSHPSQRRFPAGHGIAGLADAARRLPPRTLTIPPMLEWHWRRAGRDVRLVSRARVAGDCSNASPEPAWPFPRCEARPTSRSSIAPRRCFRRSAARADGRRSSAAS